jgi:hypothetical protein
MLDERRKRKSLKVVPKMLMSRDRRVFTGTFASP